LYKSRVVSIHDMCLFTYHHDSGRVCVFGEDVAFNARILSEKAMGIGRRDLGEV
jgi:hypothetical protein